MPPDQASQRITDALRDAGLDVDASSSHISAHAKRALLKNRWAADVSADVSALHAGAKAVIQVDMAGSKHYELLNEIADALGDDAFADQGLQTAVERLGKASKIFGRKELRHLRHLVRADEEVRGLAQGTYEKAQAIVVLTDQRLFFFEKSLGKERLEEYPVSAISSIVASKKLTGERLQFTVSGNNAEVTHVMHGQADELARQYRDLRHTPTAAQHRTEPPSVSVLDQIRQLSDLRDSGVLTADEFEKKKTELLDRL